MRSMRLTLLLAGMSLLAFRAEAGESAARWTDDSGRHETVRVAVLHGDLTIEPAIGDRIEVSALLKGAKADREAIRFVVESQDGVYSVRALYPPREHRDDPQTRVEIDVHVLLPAGIRFEGSTEVGAIEARNLDGSLDLATSIGDITLETRSHAQARTTNGRIRASLGRADWEGTLAFAAVNGDIELKLPASSDLEISATSVNGRYVTDLHPYESRRGIPGARVRGTIGHGGRRLELSTVNGDLVLKRS